MSKSKPLYARVPPDVDDYLRQKQTELRLRSRAAALVRMVRRWIKVEEVIARGRAARPPKDF